MSRSRRGLLSPISGRTSASPSLFFVVDRALKRPALAWGVYALLVVYAAINVPVTLVLSTPLTWTMMRAARGPLADAVFHYLTAANLRRPRRSGRRGGCAAADVQAAPGCDAAVGRGRGGRDRRDRSVRGVSSRDARPAPERVRRHGRDEPSSRGARGGSGRLAGQPVRPAARRGSRRRCADR